MLKAKSRNFYFALALEFIFFSLLNRVTQADPVKSAFIAPGGAVAVGNENLIFPSIRTRRRVVKHRHQRQDGPGEPSPSEEYPTETCIELFQDCNIESFPNRCCVGNCYITDNGQQCAFGARPGHGRKGQKSGCKTTG